MLSKLPQPPLPKGEKRGSLAAVSAFGPNSLFEAERLIYGEVLHQSAHRGHGHLHPHGDRRRRRHGAAARSPSSRTSCRRRSHLQATYVGADARDRRAVGGHAHRAADERRGQHELHVLDQRQQRPDEARRSISTSRPTPTSTRSSLSCATCQARVAAAAGRAQLRRHRQEVDHQRR